MSHNLLDALKSAGLADDKKARRAEQEKKQTEHKNLKRGAAAPTAEPVSPSSPKSPVPNGVAIENAELQARERLQAIYRQAALPNTAGRKKFYYQTLENDIDCMMISDVASALLERGKYAIVANAAMDDYILVSRATALAIEAVDKKRVIVFRRQET